MIAESGCKRADFDGRRLVGIGTIGTLARSRFSRFVPPEGKWDWFCGRTQRNQCPRNCSSISEEANPSAGAPIEAWKLRSACLVSPPNWPSGVPR
jgi:hypothetical protein